MSNFSRKAVALSIIATGISFLLLGCRYVPKEVATSSTSSTESFSSSAKNSKSFSTPPSSSSPDEESMLTPTYETSSPLEESDSFKESTESSDSENSSLEQTAPSSEPSRESSTEFVPESSEESLPEFVSEPSENSLPEFVSEPSEEPANDSSDYSKNPDIICYGICKKDCQIELLDDSRADLYQGQHIAIIRNLDDRYQICWYETTAVVDATCIQLFSKNYVPDFGTGQWAGCITAS